MKSQQHGNYAPNSQVKIEKHEAPDRYKQQYQAGGIGQASNQTLGRKFLKQG